MSSYRKIPVLYSDADTKKIHGLRIISGRPLINSTWDNSQTKTANYTMTASDSGYTTFLDATGGTFTITLPSTAVGLSYRFAVAEGKNTTNDLNISPAAADKIIGLGAAGVDNKDMTLASPTEGDFLEIFGDGVDGWYVQRASGTWTREA
jgi:hypothetical protein